MHESFHLPGYDILEKIGEGGTSSVWKARQLSLDRLVAIKVLDSALQLDPAALTRFRQEAQAAARLKHASIVQVYDTGEMDGRPFLVMEYVDGYTVGDLLQRSGPLTESNALLVTEAVAHALAYAWDKDCIIHLDIKPDNVLVESDGGIKVTDLGLARFIGMQRRRAEDDIIIGTPNYVSPEQAEGMEDLDCRTDIYSLGAMLYHLVTGRLPFAGRPGSSAMDAHLSEYLPDPMELNPAVSSATAWLIEKMMAKNRAYRPLYWSLVLADLAEVKQGRMPRPPLPEAGISTVLRCPARVVPLPAPLPVPAVTTNETEAPKRIVVVKAAASTQPGLQSIYDDRGFGRALAQLLFLVVAAAGVGVFFYLDMPHRIGLRPPPPPPAPEVVPLVTRSAVVPAPVVEEAPLPEIDWGDEAVAERPSSGMKDGVVVWDNADFKEGARLFNDAYALYMDFQKTRAHRDQLPRVEREVREALRKFESVKNVAPPDVDMQNYIQQCFHLIADVRHSTLLQHDEPARVPERPALPAPPSSVQQPR